MEISRAEINELFRGVKIPIHDPIKNTGYIWTPGKDGFVEFLDGSCFSQHERTRISGKIELSPRQQHKLCTLYAAHKLGILKII